jgi:hypothetical protein
MSPAAAKESASVIWLSAAMAWSARRSALRRSASDELSAQAPVVAMTRTTGRLNDLNMTSYCAVSGG